MSWLKNVGKRKNIMKMWTNIQISILIALAILLLIDTNDLEKKAYALNKRMDALELRI